MLDEMMFSEKCTGCKMCSDVCPAGAISFVEDNGGYCYPVVDKKKCIECGLCEKKCPNLNGYKSHFSEPKVFATWTKDNSRRLNSTSGGLCYELSKYIISNGGYVAGVEYTDDYKGAQYVLVNDKKGLEKITQTKYFQADTNGIYCKVKKLLDDNIMVLFIGTPCYNAALNSYLGKEYENLICCEFVCRGNPSPKVHKLHLEYQESVAGSQVVYAQSKNKKKGWSCFGSYFKFANGKEYYKDRYHHPMTIMFIKKSFNSRKSCFNCQYRTIPRVADLTVGDYWGITNVSKKDMYYGVSLLMINSEKGQQLINNIEDSLVLIEKSLEDAQRGNSAIYANPQKDEQYEQFFEDINQMSFDKIINKYVNRKDIGNKKLRNNLSKVKKILKILVKLNICKFLYYNFFCSKVKRSKGKYIFPYRGSCISLKQGAQIYVEGNLFLNTLRIKGSKAECFLLIDKGGELHVKGNARLAYNSIIQVNSDAYLEFGTLWTNVNCNITCANSIILGEDVMLGRDVVIYDSDYHTVNSKNKKKAVIIGNHVWIGTRGMIMKGSKIGDGAIISANSWVVGRVKPRTMVAGVPAKMLMEDVNWKM